MTRSGWHALPRLTCCPDSPVVLPQGRLDALWALLRRQYDRVSLMRPQQGDEVGAGRAFPLRWAKWAGYRQPSEVAEGGNAVPLPTEGTAGAKGAQSCIAAAQKRSRNPDLLKAEQRILRFVCVRLENKTSARVSFRVNAPYLFVTCWFKIPCRMLTGSSAERSSSVYLW